MSALNQFPSPYGDYGSYPKQAVERMSSLDAGVSVPLRGLWFLSTRKKQSLFQLWVSCFRPLTGIMVLICIASIELTERSLLVSVPLRGLWFLSAPLINGFIAPSKMPFAGRIFFSPHFSHFCGKWFSKIVLSLIFKPAGRNNSFYVFKKQVGCINTVLPN